MVPHPPRRLVLEIAQRLATVFLRVTRLEGVASRNTLDYRVLREETSFSNLPRSFDGFRILHLSDLHIDGILDRGRRLFDVLETLEYDLCVITGDYRFACAGEYEAVVELMRQLLQRIRCPHGVIGILGDHDALEMAPRFENMGLRVLLNASTAVTVEGESIWLAGVDGRSHAASDVPGALSGIPDGAYTILLAHAPDCAVDAASGGVDFCLAGHTHGGQLCLPLGIPILTNSRCPWKCARGTWTVGSMRGFTSRGVGASGLQARLFCPPEIVLHELRVAETEPAGQEDRPGDVLRPALAGMD